MEHDRDPCALLGIAVTGYALCILWMTLFDLARFGLDMKSGASGIIALSLVPVAAIASDTSKCF